MCVFDCAVASGLAVALHSNYFLAIAGCARTRPERRAYRIMKAAPDDLPRAHAEGAELNQVWMNVRLPVALTARP